ncbi:MAG: tRNA (cytidine(56)-2'-O)-methyltransferase [Candidatus Methanofastidiosia archaeon]
MITILRIGHRPQRDKRITTHVALVARAFGADKIVISEDDPKIKETIESIVDSWGGDFSVDFIGWKEFLRSFKGKIVHLTMYGIPFEDRMSEIRKHKDICIIVGAEKVPPEIYRLSHYNLSVGNQPHSEVSALSLFLDRYFEGKQFKKKFKNANLEIVPSECNKIFR